MLVAWPFFSRRQCRELCRFLAKCGFRFQLFWANLRHGAHPFGRKTKSRTTIILDEVDNRILAALNRDCTLSVQEPAELVGRRREDFVQRNNRVVECETITGSDDYMIKG